MVVTLTDYLGKVSEYWDQDGKFCHLCEHFDGPGYCAMLHDRTVPEGDCRGLLERDGLKR